MTWNAQRWGVGFYSFYHNTLVNSQLKLEKAYPKEAPDYLKPATRSPNPLAVPPGWWATATCCRRRRRW